MCELRPIGGAEAFCCKLSPIPTPSPPHVHPPGGLWGGRPEQGPSAPSTVPAQYHPEPAAASPAQRTLRKLQ